MYAKPLLATVVSLASVFGPSHRAAAGPVTFGFEGVVTAVTDKDNVLGGQVTLGTLITGEYTFESDTLPNVPGGGRYDEAVLGIEGHIGTIPFAGPAGELNSIRAVSAPDEFDLYSLNASVAILNVNASFGLTIGAGSGELLDSNALPVIPPNIDGLAPWFVFGTENERFRVGGDITSLVFIPEPTTLVLACVGSLVLLRGEKR